MPRKSGLVSGRTLPPHFASQARRCGRDLSLRMTSVEAVFGVFHGINAPLMLADLQPVIEEFFKPETRRGEEQPC